MNIIKKLLLILNTSIFIITLSISFIILFRPFYYYHIKYLDLENKTNYSYNEIKEAYDDIINYTVFNKPFKVGNLKYSIEGKDHFKDCRLLFMINFGLLLLSTIIILLKMQFFNNIKIFKFNISFFSSILVIISLIIILVIAYIIGFDKCFDIFHNIFFLGKDNWLFDPDIDEIIKILPQEYFMNCAIAIFLTIGLICVIIIIKEILKKRRRLYEK